MLDVTLWTTSTSNRRKRIFYKAFTQNRKVGRILKVLKAPELMTGRKGLLVDEVEVNRYSAGASRFRMQIVISFSKSLKAT